jgi:hypothetical protein
MQRMSGSRRVIVTTSGDRGLADVRADLEARGFAAEQVLEATGILIGAAADGDVAELRDVPGVADVAPDEEVNIGPPDAPVS